MTMRMLAISVVLSLFACSDDAPPDEQEVITAVILTFTPTGGPSIVFEADDPDGDGGSPPVIDPISLAAGSYTLDIAFENRLEDPPEDITAEVADEADQHQVFLTGNAVDGPAETTANAAFTHVYADADVNGLPIGLTNTITAAPQSGQLVITLRHLPPINDVAVKVSGLAETIDNEGFAGIGGDSDASVTFLVDVRSL